MKLKLLFAFIILYVISAFGWLTYSLINFSNNEYTLKSQVLDAGRQACILDVIGRAKNDEFLSDKAEAFQLKQITMNIDTSVFNAYLKTNYFESYKAHYSIKQQTNFVEIEVSEFRRQQIKSQLNKQQNNFLLSVTHEFKTPIAAIKLMMQTMARREFPREKQMELIEKTVENADRLNDLSENMLTAMQIENKRYEYERNVFSLTDLMYTIAEQHGMKGPIKTDIEEGIEYVGDQLVLRISISNLVQNAFKYSDFEEIELVLLKRNKNIVVQVKDQGIGVPEVEKKKIFKKFYRVQDEEIRTTKGTGLGLFIAQQSVRKHGGKIVVKSNKPTGTIFEIVLPPVKL